MAAYKIKAQPGKETKGQDAQIKRKNSNKKRKVFFALFSVTKQQKPSRSQKPQQRENRARL